MMRGRSASGSKRAVGSVDASLSRAVVAIALEIGPRTPELADAEAAASTAERHSIGEYLAIWELAMRTTRLPALPIRVGKAATVERYGVYGYALYVAPTVRDAFVRASRFFEVINDSGRIRLQDEGPNVAAVLDRPGPRTLGMRVANEQVLAAMSQLLDTHVGPLPTVEVRFRHTRPADTTEHAAHFRAPVVFDAGCDALVVPRAYIDRKNRGHDPVTEQYFLREVTEAAERVARGHAFTSTVAREILTRLPAGIPRASATARSLSTTERTLRRRLADSGLSYAELVAALQRDRADALLRQGASVASVAIAVGFADATAFGRAYRRWTGKSPSRYARLGTDPIA